MTAPTMRTERYESPVARVLAALIVCEFIHRMTLPKETRRLIVEMNERVQEEMEREMFYGT